MIIIYQKVTMVIKWLKSEDQFTYNISWHSQKISNEL